MDFRIFFTTVVSVVCLQVLASDFNAKIEKSEDAIWRNFFSSKTNQIYDYTASHENNKTLSHLPTANQVMAQYPNYCGYGTGMEDCAISGGAMLSALVDCAKIGGATPELKQKADKIFRGLELCTSVHGVRGFVSRGVCPEDGRSVYYNTSRDQYTHLVHGVWKYYNSDLITDTNRAKAVEMFKAIADRMIETVIPANDYDSLRLDGTHCGLGICKMWNVGFHEAARLPMIYAAAWQASGEQKYLDECDKYLKSALEQSENVNSTPPSYALLQMQCSLELLREVVDDESVKKQIGAIMKKVAIVALPKIRADLARMKKCDVSSVGPDWRKPAFWRSQSGYIIPDWGEYRTMWNSVRGCAEGIAVCQMAGMEKSVYLPMLEELTSKIDYDKLTSCGIVYHFAAMVFEESAK